MSRTASPASAPNQYIGRLDIASATYDIVSVPAIHIANAPIAGNAQAGSDRSTLALSQDAGTHIDTVNASAKEPSVRRVGGSHDIEPPDRLNVAYVPLEGAHNALRRTTHRLRPLGAPYRRFRAVP